MIEEAWRLGYEVRNLLIGSGWTERDITRKALTTSCADVHIQIQNGNGWERFRDVHANHIPDEAEVNECAADCAASSTVTTAGKDGKFNAEGSSDWNGLSPLRK